MLDYLGKNGDFLHIFLYLEKDGVMWYLLRYRDILWKNNNDLSMTISSKLVVPLISWDLLKEKYPLEVEGISKQGHDFWWGMGF